MKKCAISVDMDPVDHYLTARGYKPLDGTDINAIYTDALPRFLELFDEYHVKATFFIVAKDAENPSNRDILDQVVRRGHEIGNHTHHHFQHFAKLSAEEKRREIVGADPVLREVTKGRILGFRAPGWVITSEVLDILEGLGYTYDSSIFPSALISIIAFVNWSLNKGRLERTLGSSLNVGLAPKVPYRPSRYKVWRKGDARLVEIPPTVLPILQFPFLGTVLYMLGKTIFRLSAAYLARFDRPLVYELHGIELVDYHKSVRDDRLAVKPGLDMPLVEKEKLYRLMLSTFQSRYEFVTMSQLAACYR